MTVRKFSKHFNVAFIVQSLCQSSAKIGPEEYPELKWPEMVDAAKIVSPTEFILNFSSSFGVFLSD